MLEKLGNAIKKATDKIANAIFLDKNLVNGIVRDLQRSLIEADVNIHLIKELTDKIKKEALDERIKGIEKKEHLIKLLHDELVALLGEDKKLELKKGQNRIMLLGLYGSGKTTTIAKLGNYYAKRGKKVALVGLDVHRPAATDQLEQLAEEHKLQSFVDKKEKNPLKIFDSFKKDLKKYDVVLIDTAGRHSLDGELIQELKDIKKNVKPTESILVISSDIGQTAKSQAEKFKEAVDITGVIITKMDSTAKGGGALTACAEIHTGVYFITNGEKINDLEEFDPKSFLSRLLGMGDIDALIQKIRLVTDEGTQGEIQQRVSEGKMTLDDVIEQVKSMGAMGGFGKLKSMIPGMNSAKVTDDMLEGQESKIKRWEHIVKSMTPHERENPEVFEKETSRISRVSQGAGVNNSDIRALLKQYKMLKEMIKESASMDPSQGFNQKQMQKMMKKFGKMKKVRF